MRMPLSPPFAGASCSVAPAAASRVPPVQMLSTLWIDRVPLSASIVPPFKAEDTASVAVPVPVMLTVPSTENVPPPVMPPVPLMS